MTRLSMVVTAVLVVVVIELVTLGRAREATLAAAGVPVAVALAWLVWSLLGRSGPREPDLPDEIENGPAEMLHRWHARAQMLAERADGTRADWDRYLRPLLAKEFELSAGVRVAKNRKAIEAAGIHQFGPELWRWVDPANSELGGPGGRAPNRGPAPGLPLQAPGGGAPVAGAGPPQPHATACRR
ncbi:hypothetical protein [Nocardia cyriacigeorgica]|uniref:hypothetical protein n=1 Tax=Nocardia cyriacigeorgica TaxID=135487 RepID=UPI002455C327|nr:hypothetical protein [Nocardia cyriacigeorgica]